MYRKVLGGVFYNFVNHLGCGFGTDSKKITFNNKYGSSVIDTICYIHKIECLMRSNHFILNNLTLFHVTHICLLKFTLRVINTKIIIDRCNCSYHRCNIFKWNEGIEDDVRNQLLMNTQKFQDLLLNIDENIDIDNCVDNLNKVLTDIFEQYTKSESIHNEHCDFCVGQVKTFSAKNDKPWFTEECKSLYKHVQYQMAVDSFNKYRSNENRLGLNLAKQRYKYLENKLKRQYCEYKNQHGRGGSRGGCAGVLPS